MAGGGRGAGNIPRRAAVVAVALAALLQAPRTPASNPDSTPVSPEAALTANTVLASDDPGGGGWYNPASLAAVTRSSVQVGASAYAITSMSVAGAIETTLPWGSLSGTMSSVRYASVPSVVSYTFRLREGLGASLGVWTPFHDYAGGSTSGASSGPYPGAPGVTGSYTELYSFSRTRDDTWAGAALGWQASPRVRLGLMLQGSYSTRLGAVDFNASLKTDSADPLEGGSHLDLSERVDLSYLGLRALGGLQVDVTPEVRLALAVRSPAVRVLTWGSATRVVSAAVLLPGVPPTEYQITQELPRGTEPAVVEPVRLYAGLRWARGRWTLAAEADWHPALDRWLTGQGAAWNGRAGGTCQLSPDLTAGIGLFRDTSAMATGQTATTFDYYGLAGGVVYRPRAVVAALGGSGSWDMLTGLAVRGAYGTGSFTGARFSPVDPAGRALPAAAMSLTPQEAPAEALEGSLSLFTSIVF
jgi:hypothetical protein